MKLRQVYMDRTFKIVPLLFSQPYTHYDLWRNASIGAVSLLQGIKRSKFKSWSYSKLQRSIGWSSSHTDSDLTLRLPPDRLQKLLEFLETVHRNETRRNEIYLKKSISLKRCHTGRKKFAHMQFLSAAWHNLCISSNYRMTASQRKKIPESMTIISISSHSFSASILRMVRKWTWEYWPWLPL